MLPSYISNRKKTQRVSDRTDDIAEQIGTTNGHGTIAEMITRIITTISKLDDAMTASKTRITLLETGHKENKLMLEEVKTDIKDIKDILVKIIQEVEDGR